MQDSELNLYIVSKIFGQGNTAFQTKKQGCFFFFFTDE